MPNKYKLVFGILLAISILGAAALYFSNKATLVVALTLSALCSPCIFFMYLLWIPAHFSKIRYRRISIGIVVALSGILLWMLQLTKPLLKDQIQLNSITEKLHSLGYSSIYLYILSGILILLLALYAANKVLQDDSAMKKHSESFDIYFPEHDARQRIESFANFLSKELNSLDIETNWSDAFFTPLEAEVDTIRGLKKIKKD